MLYYQYDFISPEAVYATVKEELSSYFNSGIIDDTMFPIWTKKCLDKLGKCTHQILPAMLKITDYKAALPADFDSVREAWFCVEIDQFYQLGNAQYQEVNTFTKLSSNNTSCDIECSPEIVKVIYKGTKSTIFSFRKDYLLTPANIDSCHRHCSIGDSLSTFEIKEGLFVTNFCEGVVNLLYYSENTDNILIPDNFRIKEYIEAFIKQKAFEQVFNQTTDETFNQSFQKFQFYKQAADSAYIIASVETKKEDIYKKARMTRKTLNRYKNLDIR